MAIVRNVTVASQKTIIMQYRDGIPALKLAEHFSLSTSGIYCILQCYKALGGVYVRKQPGRPRNSTQREDSLITRMPKLDPRLTSVDIHSNLTSENDIKISSKTVQRRLVAAGLQSRNRSFRRRIEPPDLNLPRDI